MLAADKLQLQSALKQQATALKEKEFQLHHSNLMTVGTQAAVLASLDVTMFIEFQPPHDSEWGIGGRAFLIPRTLKFFYYCMITTAFCCNIIVVAQTTLLSVMGTALALRGPDGSMITATDGLYKERKTIFDTFNVGLATTIGSAVTCVWLILSPEAALVCMSITIMSMVRLHQSYLRINRAFQFDESETVDFTDIFEGPAAIRVVNNPSGSTPGSRHGSRHGQGGEGGRWRRGMGGGVGSGSDASLEYDENDDGSMEMGIMNGYRRQASDYNSSSTGADPPPIRGRDRSVRNAAAGGGRTRAMPITRRMESGNLESTALRKSDRRGGSGGPPQHNSQRRSPQSQLQSQGLPGVRNRSISPLLTV